MSASWPRKSFPERSGMFFNTWLRLWRLGQNECGKRLRMADVYRSMSFALPFGGFRACEVFSSFIGRRWHFCIFLWSYPLPFSVSFSVPFSSFSLVRSLSLSPTQGFGKLGLGWSDYSGQLGWKQLRSETTRSWHVSLALDPQWLTEPFFGCWFSLLKKTKPQKVKAFFW